MFILLELVPCMQCLGRSIISGAQFEDIRDFLDSVFVKFQVQRLLLFFSIALEFSIELHRFEFSSSNVGFFKAHCLYSFDNRFCSFLKVFIWFTLKSLNVIFVE